MTKMMRKNVIMNERTSDLEEFNDDEFSGII